MRNLPEIELAWSSGGPYTGTRKPVTRVTIQEPWPALAGTPEADDFLQTVSVIGVGSSASRGVPLRWYQDVGNTQGMREVPNLSSVSVDRSIDQDAGTVSLSLSNQWMRQNGAGVDDGVTGQPGYFTPTRGNSPEAFARWGHIPNDWNNYLVPNALIRVYTGFGGEGGNVLDRVADGTLALYGVFLLDTVDIQTDGTIQMKGRDMMKLLIDQQLFPPLVPATKYPLSYERWTRKNERVRNAPTQVTTQVAGPTVTEGDKNTQYVDSSADRWYGCVDTETEALTARGWQPLDGIRPDDLIYGLDHRGQGVWQPLRDLSRYEVEDETMHHWKGGGFDALTTWNHRWLTHRADDSETQRWVISREMKSGWGIPTRANYGDAPSEKKYSDAFVEIVGWYWTEGTTGRRGMEGSRSQNAVIYQSRDKNPDNCDRIIAALTEEWGQGGDTLRDNDTLWVSADYGKGECYRLSLDVQVELDAVAPNRTLDPSFLQELTQDQIDLLFRTSIAADGYWSSPTHAFLTQKTTARTKAFELLAVLAGYKVTTRQHSTDTPDLFRVSCVKGSDTFHFKRSRHETVTTYTGTVWCPTVKYGNWMARRNGTTFFTGNSNASIHGHRGSDSVDGNPSSYALSVGNSGPDRPFTTDYWEYSCGELMNAVYLHPWRGGYTMYVSVKVGGQWQGSSTVPYDPSVLFTSQSPAVNTGANIPYVASFTVDHETPREYVLPTGYNAERVRISFRNHVDSGIGVWRYRCGIRELVIRGVNASTTSSGTSSSIGTTTLVDTYVPAADARYEAGKLYSQGYVTSSAWDAQDAFGDSRRLARNTPGALEHVRCIRYNKTVDGYYVMSHDGTIRAHGAAVHYGDPITNDAFDANTPEAGGDGFTWDLAMTPSGLGYWVISSNGNVYAYGDAEHLGSVHTTTGLFATAIDSHPTGQGYWILRSDGKVFSYGAASAYGNIPITGEGALKYQFGTGFSNRSEQAQSMRRTSTGNGYWIMTTTGRVFAYGDAKHFGQPAILAQHPNNVFTEVYWDILPAPDDRGYLLVHANGKISHHGDIEYFGAPVPGTEASLRYDGNYLDYSDIVRDLILWSGFLFYDLDWPLNQPAPAYASIESTGAFAKERLPDDIFDKRPVIDAITTIKQVVGYIVWVDQEGRFRFESPNWWHIGNFDEDGYHQPVLHDIDERVHLTGHAINNADESLRSSIIISSHDPYADLSGTVTHSIVPPSAHKLRGLVKPAMWINDFFIDPDEQQIMAELISLHISFQERVGQLTCVANPAIELNDQIRIYERQTEEVYVHYVRGIGFSHNLDSNEYMTTLTTHWLGEGTGSSGIVGSDVFPISAGLSDRVEQQQYGKLSKNPPPRIFVV